MSLKTIRTPCVGVCSTGIGDSVCRGCKRFDYEVIDWNSYDLRQKQAIDLRLSRILSDVIASRMKVFSESLLQTQLKAQQIRYAEWRDANCWLYELLRAGATQIDMPADYGFSVLPRSQHLTLGEIRDKVEQEVYALSVAHYERFIVANQRKAVIVP